MQRSDWQKIQEKWRFGHLHNIVGDTEIRKGEGMELDQLVQNAYMRDKPAYIQPFDMETLGQAFQLRDYLFGFHITVETGVDIMYQITFAGP